MIRQIRIQGFKRFRDETFILPGHIVLAGPNNCGKTTVLQAIAAWGLAFERWKQLNEFQRRGGAYPWAPIARQTFSAVPLGAFGHLWTDRAYSKNIEIEVKGATGWTIAMELHPDSTEQINVRPRKDAAPESLKPRDVPVVYVPPMTGLGIEEPVYQRPKLDQLLGQSKPGDVIRNLIVEAHRSDAWGALCSSIERLFGYELLPPDATGPHIVAEYKHKSGSTALDIASAGSGFQQVLMLLAFLHTRPASVLLLDEPDAHLHVILQDAIYGELRSVAAAKQSQLVIATHSEVIVNSVDPKELCLLIDKPRLLASTAERQQLADSLGILTQTDIMLATEAPGILYVEDYTDIEILRAWAGVLDHPARKTLTTDLFWKKEVSQPRRGAKGIQADDHYAALQLVRSSLPGLALMDRDGNPNLPETSLSGRGLQRIRWSRYEIENYLVHPDALARFVLWQVGDAGAPHVEDLRKYLEENLPPAILKDPLGDHVFLVGTKARTLILPPALDAAGLQGLPYTRYHEIAALMTRDEIHPEVIEKLDAIQKAFGR